MQGIHLKFSSHNYGQELDLQVRFLVLERWSHTHWIHVTGLKFTYMIYENQPAVFCWKKIKKQTQTCQFVSPVFCWKKIQLMNFWVGAGLESCGYFPEKKRDSSRRTQNPPTPNFRMMFLGCFGKGWSWPSHQDEKSTACSQLWNSLKLKLKKVWWFRTTGPSRLLGTRSSEGWGGLGVIYQTWLLEGPPMNWIKRFLLQRSVFQPAMLVYSLLGRFFVHEGAQKIWRDLVCNSYGGYPKNSGTGEDHCVNRQWNVQFAMKFGGPSKSCSFGFSHYFGVHPLEP